MNLKIRDLGKGDSLGQIFSLCRENGLTAPCYPLSQAIWDFQYVRNPKGQSWSSVAVEEGHGGILGHLGLTPFPLTVGGRPVDGALVSNIVIQEGIRKNLLFYKGLKTFPIVPLAGECCYRAFADGVNLIFAYSRIPVVFWRSLQFENLSLERRVTWHCGARELHGLYVRELGLRIAGGWRKFLVRPYGYALTAVQLLCSMLRRKLFVRTWRLRKKINYAIEGFMLFDESFNVLMDSFFQENPDMITHRRDIAHLNWLFESSRYAKYKFLVNGHLVGYCVIFRNDDPLRPGGAEMYDCIILRQYMEIIPEILNELTLRQKRTIELRHFLGCPFSRDLFVEFTSQGYQPFLRISEIVCNKPHRTVTESSFYYRLNTEMSFVGEHQVDFRNPDRWFINPLFFGPMYYE